MSGHHAPSQEQRILTGVDTLLQNFKNTYLKAEAGIFPSLLKEMKDSQGGFTTDFRGLKPKKIADLEATIPTLNLILNTVLTHDLSLQEICSPLIQLMQQLVILEENNRNTTLQYNQSSTMAYWIPGAQADEGTFGRHIQEAKKFIDTALRSSLSPEDFTTIQDYLQKPKGDLDLKVLTLASDELEEGYAAGDEEDSAPKPRQDGEMQEQDLKADDSEEMPLDPDSLAAIAAEAIATEQGCPQTDSAQSEQTAASEPATTDTISTQPKAESTLQDLDRMHVDQLSRLSKKISSEEISTTTAPAAAYTRPTPTAAVTMPPPPTRLNLNAAPFSFGDFSNPSSAPSSSVQAPVEQRPAQSSHSYSNARHQPYSHTAPGFHGLGVVANFPHPGAVAGFINTPHGPVPGVFIPQPAPGIQQRPRAPQYPLASQGGHTSTTPRAPQYPLAAQGAYNTATPMRGAHHSSRGHGHRRDTRHTYPDGSYPHQ